MAFTRPKAAQIDFDVTNISDPLIRLNSGASGSNTKDVGIVIERGSDTNVALIWDESTDSFAVINTTEDGTTSGDVTISSYADLTLKKVTQSEQQYTTSNMMKFNQLYTGASIGSYFAQNEYQKILTITPAGDSENYQVSGRIIAQSGGSIQTINFNVALRSNTLPDLNWSITYTDVHNGTAFFKPQLWTKETTTAGFIIAIQKISSSNLYGTVTVDIDVIPRSSSQKANVVMNTVQNSEQTTVDTGFTAHDMTKIMEINGDDVDISAHDGSSDGLKLGGTLITATAAELNYVDGVTSNIQTQIDNISSSFTLAADSGTNDTFTTGQTLTIAGGTGITTTVTDNQVSIALDSGAVVTPTGSQTLSNKTLTAPVISSISNTGTLTLPTSTGTVALRSDIPTAVSELTNDSGYSTTTGTVTSVAGTGTVNGLTLSGTVTSSGSLTLGGTFSATVSEISDLTATAAELNILDGVTATTAELNYVDGVTSNIQTQLDAALPKAGGQMTGNITFSGSQTVDGRDLSADGAKLDGIEASADVTDTANVTAAGALMDSEVTNLAQVKAFDSSDYATAAQGSTADAALPKTGGTMSGAIAMGTNKITGMGDPTANQDAATKAYVDSQVSSVPTGDITAVNITAGTGLSGTVTTASGDHTQTISIDSTVATLTGSQTLTNKTLTSPQITTDLRMNAQAAVEFYDSDSSNYVSFRAPATIGSNVVWTLPASDGTADQVLATNGAGVLEWADGGSGGGSGSSYPNSTFTTCPGSEGDFDLAKNVAQTTAETPFEAGGTDAFGVNLGSVFSCMDPVGSVEGPFDMGALT